MTLPFFRDAIYEGKKAGGSIVIDGKEVAHTLQCPHCSGQFVSIKGSGKKRGWCHVCKKVVCGQKDCMIHLPYDIKFAILEARSRGDHAEAMKIEMEFFGSIKSIAVK